MRILKKTRELIRQNEQIAKKPQKHDANLQKNSTLYFQMGLIVCLLGAYGLLEMKFESVSIKDNDLVEVVVDQGEAPMEKFKVYEKPAAKVKPKAEKKIVLTKDPIIVDDDQKIIAMVDIITPDQNTTSDPPLDTSAIDVGDEPVDEPVVDFVHIEQVPIYPGCENKRTNPARRKCMTDKLTKLIQRKFRTDLAQDLGLTGIQNIQTQFTIDKSGKIINVRTRAPHPKLESEAQRVINAIPLMEPGKQRNKAVGVKYTLPIKFQVED